MPAQTDKPTFQIEKGVPLPARRFGRKSRFLFPFEQMEIGDSFAGQKSDWASAQAAMRRFCRMNGKEFTIRKLEDGGFRIWRVA